jgi:glutathione S-transferase
MKLYGVRTSPYVRHARVALSQSNLEWELEQVTLDTISRSPTLRVPFLIDGDLTLSDSSVIVRYVREQSGQAFLATVADHELFALATSVLDTAVNVYLMNIGDSADLAEVPAGASAIGFDPKTYFERQQERIAVGMQELEHCQLSSSQPYTDGEIRLACLLDWAAYRETIDLSGKDNLCRFLADIRAWPPFAETAPDL